MRFPAFSIVLLLCGALGQTQAQTIDEIILNDMFVESSPKCSNNKKATSTKKDKPFYTYDYSSSPSSWKKGIVQFQKKLFQAEMKYDDPNDSSRSWKIRVASGGNIYSIRGLFGEVISPQNLANAPWVDEVLQSVAVNSIKNSENKTSAYFIHQAGVYTTDDEYTKTPFHSPSLASHCEEDHGSGVFQCSFVGWGQQAHVPTTHGSTVLFFNRYQDCGDGVVEYTSMIYNMPVKWKNTMDYLNVPWGGVRTYTFPHVYLSNKKGELVPHFPLQSFGTGERTMPNLWDTGGFTTFTEKIEVSKEDLQKEHYQFYMPEADGKGGMLPPNKAKNQRTLRENSASCSASNGKDVCTANGANPYKGPKELKLVVRYNNSCKENDFNTKKRSKYTVTMDIKNTVEIKDGQYESVHFVNRRTNKSIRVDGILHWSWQGNKMFFFPSHGETCQKINNIFKKDDVILVKHNFGHGKPFRRVNDNLALTFVHGQDEEYWNKNRKKNPWMYETSRLRFGKTSQDRGFTVFTVNVRAKVHVGNLFSYRQYMMFDKFENTEKRVSDWVPETKKQVVFNGHYEKTTPIRLILSPDGKSYGATHEKSGHFHQAKNQKNVICEGKSTPSSTDLTPLFAIQCGSSWYTGTDLYYFAPKASFSTEEHEDVAKNSHVQRELHSKHKLPIVRSYACRHDKKVRPEWKLLGFFKEGECDALSELPYDADLFSSFVPLSGTDEL